MILWLSLIGSSTLEKRDIDMQSKLTKSQELKHVKEYTEGGTKYRITAKVSHDDCCGNGHNSFAITGDIDEWRGNRWREHSGGCIHDDIAKHFPELEPFIKWHLTSTDGPMHYVANTRYHAKDSNIGAARSCAIWPDATLEQLLSESALNERLPVLMADFQSDVESLGLVY